MKVFRRRKRDEVSLRKYQRVLQKFQLPSVRTRIAPPTPRKSGRARQGETVRGHPTQRHTAGTPVVVHSESTSTIGSHLAIERIVTSCGAHLLTCAHESFENLVVDCASTFASKLFIELIDVRSRLQCPDEALEIGKIEISPSLRVSFLNVEPMST